MRYSRIFSNIRGKKKHFTPQHWRYIRKIAFSKNHRNFLVSYMPNNTLVAQRKQDMPNTERACETRALQ